MKKLLLVAIAYLGVVGLAFSQNTFWHEAADTPAVKKSTRSRVFPEHFKLFSLEVDNLKRVLQYAPHRGRLDMVDRLEVAFPDPEGNVTGFRVQETALLHPDLAAKYPSIKSYVGQGIEDPTAIIRFSYSDQAGFHGMISSGNRMTYYIDPYTEDHRTYTVYGREEIDPALKSFECFTEAVKQDQTVTGKSNMQGRTNDQTLRRYRLALSCTAEYGNIFAGSGSDAQKIANILAQMNVTMTRVNGVFERDLAITMQLVANNDEIIYFGAANQDPWTNEWNSKTQQVNDQIIGSANYDIGHNFNTTGGGNAGCIACVCINGSKGSAFTGRSNPTGDPFDIDYVAHEMGHQFGGYHTQSNSACLSGSGDTEVEPGSGSTIMGYAGICSPNVQNNSDAYFHYVNIRDISANVQSGASAGCADEINLSNNPPSADAGPDYIIPRLTAFILHGQGSDPDGDAITYTWEQNDPQISGANNQTPSPTKTIGPMFRSIEGTTSPDRYFPSIQDVVNNNLAPTWEVIPSVGRTLNFALTVRDNRAGGGQTSDDLMRVTVNASSGPFVVTAPNTNVVWNTGQTEQVTWNVAGTSGAPVNCTAVNIRLSTDGGFTYPILLLANTPNDGSEAIIVPNAVSSSCRIKVEGANNIFYDISNANFSIQGAVVCNAVTPTGLTASGITDFTTTLSWNEISGATYDVRYRQQGTATWTTQAVAALTFQLTGLSANTAYEAQVRSVCPSGNSTYSGSVNFTTIGGSGCIGGISSFPYSESFEGNIGAWTQASSDDLDWTVDSNGTPSSGTGPASAADGTFYIYTEASGSGTGFPNKVAIISSPCFDLGNLSNATISFRYHMNGSAMGSLNLEASAGGGVWNSLWSRSGSDGNAWTQVTLNVGSYAGGTVQFRFVGTTGTDYTSDMALDLFELTTSSSTGCQNGIASFPYQEGFEGSIGLWTQFTGDELDWTVDANGTPSSSTGPSSAFEGAFYLYTEASVSGTGFPNKTAILLSPCFDLSAETGASVSFYYHMFGADMGTLALEGSDNNGSSWTTLFTRSGNQGNSWSQAQIDLSSYVGGNLLLRFIGTTGSNYRSDMAIDNFLISTGNTTPECSDVVLTLTLDNYAEETSWEITNAQNNVVASHGLYNANQEGQTVVETNCLDEGCYVFTINDSYGDGICCLYGAGSYSVSIDGNVVASGGSFGSFESTSFCISGASKAAQIVREVEWSQLGTPLKLHPNPVIDELHVSIPEKVVIKSMQIINSGGTVMEIREPARVIDVAHLPAGLYILRADTDGGTYRNRFMKE